MTSSKPIRLSITFLMITSLALPPVAFAEEVIPDSPVVEPAVPLNVAPLDVAINTHGQLVGTVVDEQGNALSDTTVYLLQENGAILAIGASDADGGFVFNITQGGVYQVVADGSSTLLRCWAQDTAPPTARERLLVSIGPLQRGQIHPAVCGFGNPWVITGIVAAAIVIPVAIHNNRGDRPGSSQ